MKKIGLLSFLFCCSFTVFVQANVDLFLTAIEQNQLTEVSTLIKDINFDKGVSLEQIGRFQQAFKNASPEMLNLLETIGTEFLSESGKQEDLDQLLEASNKAPEQPSFFTGVFNSAGDLFKGISKDPKVWFFFVLQNAVAIAQNTTNDDPGFITKGAWDSLLDWSRQTYILSWTLVAIFIIVPTTVSCLYCFCGSKKS